MTMRRAFSLVLFLGSFVYFVASSRAEPCSCGLQPGQRPGPYSFVLATGQQRGQAQCFICETADHPAIIVFARTPDDALGKLVSVLDKELTEHRDPDVRAWVTFLSDDQPALDPQVVRWAQQHAIRKIPLGVFEDPAGPPNYRLAHEADVTVLFFVKRKVVASYAFRPGELTDTRIAEVLQALPMIVGDGK